MKKAIVLICTAALILSLSVSSAAAYVLPAGMAVSLEEGADLSSISAIEVYGYVGDADLNGKLNIRDATLIQKYAANISELSEEALRLADADFSEKVNVRDATAVQKWLAGISIYPPVGHALYALDDDGQTAMLVDKWAGKVNIAEEINKNIDAGEDVPTFKCVEITFLFDIKPDGTYSFMLDESSLDGMIKQVKDEYAQWIVEYLESYIKENKLDTTVNEMLKLSGFSSVDEMVDQALPSQDIISQIDPVNIEGRYLVKGNGIYLSDSVDVEAKITQNGMYYDFKDINLVIVTGGNLLNDSVTPVEFERVNR